MPPKWKEDIIKNANEKWLKKKVDNTPRVKIWRTLDQMSFKSHMALKKKRAFERGEEWDEDAYP